MIPLLRPDERLGRVGEPRWFGVYCAVVVDVVDPEGVGRVRVQLPWAHDVDGTPLEAWCRLLVPMAGAGRGTWFVPEVGDEVAVAFEAGDPRRPFVVGALWNGVDGPPERMDAAGRNDVRAVHSRAGIRIRMDDGEGRVGLTLDTPAGQRVALLDGERRVVVEDANGNRVTLDGAGISVESRGRVTVSASAVEVTAGSVTVNAGLSKFSGVVQADTVIANAVVASSYTPGAGNIW